MGRGTEAYTECREGMQGKRALVAGQCAAGENKLGIFHPPVQEIALSAPEGACVFHLFPESGSE